MSFIRRFVVIAESSGLDHLVLACSIASKALSHNPSCDAKPKKSIQVAKMIIPRVDQDHPEDPFMPEELAAGSMRHEHVRLRRREILASSERMRPLFAFVNELRCETPSVYVPCFDPACGDVQARVLFLLEKPGPKTAPDLGGSGFVSPCNNDPTAKAMHAILAQRGLPFRSCIFWNVIPWWDDTIAFTSRQQRDGFAPLRRLLGLLPALRAIVLVGNTAQRSWKRAGVEYPAAKVYRSAHPGARVRATNPQLWNSIPSKWPSYMDIDCPEPSVDAQNQFNFRRD